MRKLADKSDAELIAKVNSLKETEGAALVDMLLYLNEIKYRKLHLERGYRSVYKFLTDEFGFTRSQSYLRICAADAVALEPEVEMAIREYRTCPSFFQSAIVAIRREDKRRRICGESKVESAQKRSLYREILKAKEARRPIAKFFPLLKPDYNEEKPITAELTQYTMAATKEEVGRINRLKELLSSKTDGSWHDIVMEMVELTLAKQDPLRKPIKAVAASTANGQRKYISVFTERELQRRSGGQCEFVCEMTGRRCEERRELQTDHIIPIAHGGTDSYQNLRKLCRAHNIYAAWKKGLPVDRYVQA